MRYCDTRKLIFFFPARTGSTTFDYLLEEFGTKRIRDMHRHEFPKTILEAYPKFADYKRYGFFRNPLDRFISAVKHIKKNPHPMMEGISFKDYPRVADPKFFAKQVDTLEGCELLDFDNYDAEIAKIADLFGYKRTLFIPKSNTSSDVTVEVDNDTTEFVRDYYAGDYKLALDVFNKTY